MKIQEWKTKINSFFQPKNPAERQKIMKYMVVFPAAILSGIVILWLIYSNLNKNEAEIGDAFNTEMPTAESNEIGTKVEEYVASDMEKDKNSQEVVIATLDTLMQNSDSTQVEPPSSIEQSAAQFQQVQQSLDNFYIPDYSESTQVAELQARIDELETQNLIAQQQTQQPDEMELLERSYQLAAQYMGNGNAGNIPNMTPQKEEKGKRNVQPVAHVNRNVVSSLGSSSSRGFNTSVGNKPATSKNTISAIIAGNQSVTDGQTVKLRLTEPMWIGHSLVPRGTILAGISRLQGERLGIEITAIESNGSVFEVELEVYDSDGQKGINIPNSLESDALHEIGANMGSTMGSSINLTTNAGAQIASDVGRGLINGVSQYLNKKMRTVKVHLKSGYKVMIHQPEDV